ncbi:MmgE/PrpD family protein [Mesorhizobium sp.]|uniref:MmgE/PrpD family protein n=1 Tax=Mesorhizobium sp. TaxID=1871066 RepID=UPI000FE35CA6|nr:MmgE/PrpD family protein [Mesorhizobium sp.]RWH72908.1 MAG: MmgE/PrpD family protein [Mesorhizobium sp.]RWL34206.1 MAG: MmgE/PrpD family protein [Mesorhizobium sp.]RWL35622.1 MAG: MmgE/PrpD family protein [Mesorhizobium sp.]RWL41032.1 MAG: MmgE/PrpD family protein [Mesorhizobium sp.]RWL52202.1 MAG: MmgE/PrpD family protein [Mesorhizobium sp.]
MSPTERLGNYLAASAGRALSRVVSIKAAICLLDALGLAVAARSEPTTRAAVGIAAKVATGAAAATIWTDGRQAGVGDAVLANGVAVHAHFQDDTDHDSWSHPGSLVPPVAIALTENDTVEQALRALVAGYATINWLGIKETVSRSLITRGLRTSPTFGTIGAAAAGAVALGLDAAQARSAVAIAAAATGGTLEPVRSGTDEWRIQNGRAAQGGLVAALLASQGVQGAPDALSGPKGFLSALAGMAEPPAEWSRDPDPEIMLEIMAKPYATLGDNMPAVMAADVARRRGLDPARIKRVSVTLWRPYAEYPGTAFKGPFERSVQTQASTAFAVAAVLLHGDVTYDMGVDLRADPALNALVAKTTIVPDDVNGALDSTVTIELDDGRTLVGSAADAPRTLILQDEARSIEVFEGRLAAAGRMPGAGVALAEKLFAASSGKGSLPVSELLRDLHPAPGNV